MGLVRFIAMLSVAVAAQAAALPVEAQVGWAVGRGDSVPRGAVEGGREANGARLFPCVAIFADGLHPGKVRPGFGGCNIPYGGREHAVQTYRVPLGGVWRSASGGSIPANAVPAGFEANGTPLYVCRASHAGGVHPGKIRSGFGGCNVPFGGGEHTVSRYEVLTEW